MSNINIIVIWNLIFLSLIPIFRWVSSKFEFQEVPLEEVDSSLQEPLRRGKNNINEELASYCPVPSKKIIQPIKNIANLREKVVSREDSTTIPVNRVKGDNVKKEFVKARKTPKKILLRHYKGLKKVTVIHEVLKVKF